MAILNYTTRISTEKTAAVIQKKSARAKAQSVLCEYDDETMMCAMSFRIMRPHGVTFFQLPVNTQCVFKALAEFKYGVQHIFMFGSLLGDVASVSHDVTSAGCWRHGAFILI